MTHPDIVQSALGDEGVAARVDLGDDALFVTPTRTILYRADKLLSDESVKEFPHGAERVSASSGRRKATITLDYGLDGERSFSVPVKALDRTLHPVLAGTLNATGVTVPGETVKETFIFSDLTLIVTSERIVKHIGGAVWDEEFEEFHYDDVTNLSFEEGSVATTMVVTLGNRQERFKAPNEEARAVRERLTSAVLEHHEVDNLDALREKFAVDEDEPSTDRMSFGEGPTPLSVNPGELTNSPKNATRVDTAEESAGEPQSTDSATTEADASEPDSTAAKASVDAAAESAAATDSSGSVETEPTPPTDHDEEENAPTAGSGDIDMGSSETLLGPVDDGDGDSDEDDEGGDGAQSPSAAPDSTQPSNAELGALVTEVEALRASVEEQSERITHQEELIERLISELRNRR